ncbi:MAG: MFS transporter [Chloroflexi bacterium]|nr:MFS transporter [Chloroflexota bacterium]
MSKALAATTSIEVAGQTRWSVLPLFAYTNFATHVATGLLVPLLPFIRDQFGLSYFQAGLLLSGYSVAAGFATPPMGWLADRVSLRWLAVVTMAGTALATLAIGVTRGFWSLLALVIVMGLCHGAFHPMLVMLLSSYFHARRRGLALGLNQVGSALGGMVAPTIGGLIALALGWRNAFVFLAIPALVAVPFYLRMRLDKGMLPEEDIRASPASVGVSPSLVHALRPIFLIYFLFESMRLIAVGITNLLPIFMVDKHLVAPAYAAMTLALIRLGGLAGGPGGGWVSDRLGRKQGTIVGLAATGPLVLALVLLPLGTGLILAVLLLGAIIQFRQPPILSLLMESAPRGRRGLVLGIHYFFGSETRSLLIPFIGLSMDVFGLTPTFTGLGVVAVTLSALTLLLRGRL